MTTSATENAPVVLITGAARRIGAATARVFHQNGYRVIIHYRHSATDALALQYDLNKNLDKNRPHSATTLQADLDDPQAVLSLARDAMDCFGRIDVLVNNASAFFPTAVGSITQQQWDDLFNSNARAPLFLSQALTAALRESHGSIVNLTDMNADRGMEGFTPYTMAKAALQAMTRSLAKELAPEVRVNSVAPGAILWPEHTNNANDLAEQHARILAGIPAGRLGTEDDIANTVFFLAHEAHYITGENIRVDGGRALT